MKDIKLCTSSKYKHNKFQIKYLKYKRYNMVLFATYSTELNVNNIFVHKYEFFIYFDRTSRTLHYVEDTDYYGVDTNIRPLMIRFGIVAYNYLTYVYINKEKE